MTIQKRENKKADRFVACPDPDNILNWYFVIFGLDGNFEGGFYLGMIEFAEEYPFKPPKVKMLTPNGRFKEKNYICFSMTHFHPESWSSQWNA